MKKVIEAQKYLQERKWDGWLLYDFHGTNPLARRFLQIPSHQITTRRFFYWIPAHGTPIQIVHAIEPHVLDHCPGEKRTYLSWQSLEGEVKRALRAAKKVAMEYSPRNGNPYIGRADAGHHSAAHRRDCVFRPGGRIFHYGRRARAPDLPLAKGWHAAI
jgi:hypothetical protein